MGQYFGEFIKELRIDRKLTLRDVEEKAKISNAYLSQVERGERGTPTMKILVKLAKVYGVPVSVLSNKVEAELEFEREKAKKTKEEQNPEEAKEAMPNPETDFICRGYENLSEDKKRSLKDFLFYLQKEDKGKRIWINPPYRRIQFQSGLGKEAKSPAFGSIIIKLQDQWEVELINLKESK